MKSWTKKYLTTAVLAAAAAAMFAPSSEAALKLELRTSSGSKAFDAAPGQAVQLQVYAVVTGTDGQDNEGFGFAYYNLRPTGVNIGDLSLAGLPTANTAGNIDRRGLPGPFASDVSAAGRVFDYDGNGMDELGSGTPAKEVEPNFTANPHAGLNTFRTASASGVTSTGGADNREFLIQTVNFLVDPSATAGAATIGIELASGGGAEWAILQDGVATSGQTTGYTAGLPVTINVVPEPASLSLLGLGATALLGRRRRK